MRASWIFTTNDMLANFGIALSGVAVMLLKSPLPDLIIGIIVVGIGIKGGWEILEQARQARGDRVSAEHDEPKAADDRPRSLPAVAKTKS